MKTIFDFERYSATGIYLFTAFIVVAAFYAILLREAKEQNSNWSAPVWFANITILVLSCFAGSLLFRIIEVATQLSIPEGFWNLIPVAILGWISIFFIHSIIKKVMPVQLKFIALKMFS